MQDGQGWAVQRCGARYELERLLSRRWAFGGLGKLYQRSISQAHAQSSI